MKRDICCCCCLNLITSGTKGIKCVFFLVSMKQFIFWPQEVAVRKDFFNIVY